MTPPPPGTVLVTGATGFVGRGLVPRLAAAGWTVRAAARAPQRIAAGAGIEPVAAPELSAAAADWRPLVTGVTHIVHLAGLAHMSASIPESTYMAVNAEATAALASAARKARVRRIVLVSSIRAQVGPFADRVVCEKDPQQPTDAYGRSKLAAERNLALELAGGGTEGVVLRPVLVYGPGVKGNMATLFRTARLGLPLPLGSLNNRRSLVSLGNLSSAISHALLAPQAAGGTFLVADAEPIGVAGIIAALRAGLGRPAGLVSIPLSPLASALRLVGRTEMWSRIAGDLVADSGALHATGWSPPELTAAALAEAIRADASGSA
jgi:nucleoside-diphosphate-sugar epimerase